MVLQWDSPFAQAFYYAYLFLALLSASQRCMSTCEGLAVPLAPKGVQ